MTIRWTPDGKVDRKEWGSDESGDWIIIDSVIPLADALDECIRRLRVFYNAGDDAPTWVRRDSFNTLLEIGVEP